MQSLLVLGVICTFLVSRSSAARGHPIVKVIDLLQDLAEKAEFEGREEEVSFSRFTHWCKTSLASTGKAIAESKEKAASLGATTSAKAKEVAALEEQIAALEADLGKKEASAAALDNDRKRRADLYKGTRQDLEGTVEAIKEAIATLKAAKHGSELVQLNPRVRHALALAAAFAPKSGRGDLTALLQDAKTRGKEFELKSRNIIELLTRLRKKFEEDLEEASKAETNAINAYELTKGALQSAVEMAKGSKKQKEGVLADAKADLATSSADLKDTKEDLAADTATYEETQKTCHIKTSEWEERSATRARELESIGVAIKILAKVGGVRTEAPENQAPPSSPIGELQLRSAVSLLQLPVVDPRMQAVNFLRAQAKVMHARVLEKAARQLADHLGSPFGEVTGMVQKMIFRLMAEQKDEDEHKLWCDKEVSSTNSSKLSKVEKLDLITANADKASAEIQELTDQIAEAGDMITAIDAHVADASDIRRVGMEENQLAIKDAESAQAAISNAVAVLQAFYKKSGMESPVELVQRRAQNPAELPEEPSTWESGYVGVSDPNAQPGGIVTILEKISSDFARMEADTRAQENVDQKAFERETSDCAIEKSRRMKEVEMMTQQRERLTAKSQSLAKTKKHVSSELDAVEQYLKDLMPACILGDSTYEERKDARGKEIEALREAQHILEQAFKKTEKTPAAKSAFLQVNLS